MNQNDKGTLKQLWERRNMSVEDFFKSIVAHPDLKFLLTTVGVWYVLRCIVGIWIGAHVIYFVCRIFNVVLG